MSTLAGLPGRKTDAANGKPARARENPVLGLDHELFSPPAAQPGEASAPLRKPPGAEDTPLHSLLAEAEYHLNELDLAKSAMRKLIEPVSKNLRAFEIAKSEKLSLQAEVDTARLAYRKLRDEHAATEKKAAALEGECLRLRQDLAIAQRNTASLEAAKAEHASTSRRLADAENFLSTSQTQLQQLESSVKIGEEEQVRLSLALDEAREKHAGELHAQRSRFETLQARAAACDKLLEEARTALSARSEKIRSFEQRFADAIATRAAVENKLAQLALGVSERDGKIRELEQARAALVERNEALNATVASREDAYNRAQERLQELGERVQELEAELQVVRQTSEARVNEARAAPTAPEQGLRLPPAPRLRIRNVA